MSAKNLHKRSSGFQNIVLLPLEKRKNARGVAQLVACLTGGQEVASSSLATPTKEMRLLLRQPLFFGNPIKIN